MKITLKELRTMIQESVVKALKEQGPPNPLLNPFSGNQGTMTRTPPVPGQTTAPTATPVQTPAQTGQRQAGGQGSPTTNVTNAINSIIRRLNVITRKALSATPRGGQPQFLPANVIISDIATMQPILNRLKTNLDIKITYDIDDDSAINLKNAQDNKKLIINTNNYIEQINPNVYKIGTKIEEEHYKKFLIIIHSLTVGNITFEKGIN